MTVNFVETNTIAKVLSSNQQVLATSTVTQTNTLVQTGITYALENSAVAIANATAAGSIDGKAFLQTYALGASVGGSNFGTAQSFAQVDCYIQVPAGQKLSAEYIVDMTINAKDTKTISEYNRAYSESVILVFDVSNSFAKPKIVGYIGVDGTLKSTQNQPNAIFSNVALFGSFSGVTKSEIPSTKNGIDSLEAVTQGTYNYTAKSDTLLAFVKVTFSDILFGTDPLLQDYKNQAYKVGTFENDRILGSFRTDKIYGGWGNDTLVGAARNDILVGGEGNDVLRGGAGADILTGGSGADKFAFGIGAKQTIDTITDFEIGKDKIVLSKRVFRDLTSNNGTINSADYSKITFNSGILSYNGNQIATIQFANSNSNTISQSDIQVFASDFNNLPSLTI